MQLTPEEKARLQQVIDDMKTSQGRNLMTHASIGVIAALLLRLAEPEDEEPRPKCVYCQGTGVARNN